MIVIIDYDAGNLGSILNMLKKIGVPAKISSDIKDIENANKLILPGVGKFDYGINNLRNGGLIDLLNRRVLLEKCPILGICLGMQLFSKSSGEGKEPGLGWIDAETKYFSFANNSQFKIPHMGWNTINVVREGNLFKDLCDSRYYFVHSYHLVCKSEEIILAKTYYGYDFVSAIQKNNIVGVQFHPEKSHKYGLKLLTNWVKNQ
jgi:imidazole glycerol-phosphate synthase subunit HisH